MPTLEEALGYLSLGTDKFPDVSGGQPASLAARHLYAVQFEGYIVKIGVTVNPKLRFAQHLSTGRGLGVLPIRA